MRGTFQKTILPALARSMILSHFVTVVRIEPCTRTICCVCVHCAMWKHELTEIDDEKNGTQWRECETVYTRRHGTLALKVNIAVGYRVISFPIATQFCRMGFRFLSSFLFIAFVAIEICDGWKRFYSKMVVVVATALSATQKQPNKNRDYASVRYHLVFTTFCIRTWMCRVSITWETMHCGATDTLKSWRILFPIGQTADKVWFTLCQTWERIPWTLSKLNCTWTV